jgi:hypothetical protein
MFSELNLSPGSRAEFLKWKISLTETHHNQPLRTYPQTEVFARKQNTYIKCAFRMLNLDVRSFKD